jgi:glutaredoxin-like protein
MIPLKDQEAIQQKLAAELVGQVKIDYFTDREVTLSVPGKQPCQYCKPVREMLQEISGVSGGMISLRIHYLEEAVEERRKWGVERVPGIVIRGGPMSSGQDDGEPFVVFYGIPGGTEFPAFLETIIDFSRRETLLSEASLQALSSLEQDVRVRVFVTPTCQYCPGMMRAAFQLALSSPRVAAETIEVNEFPELADRYKVQAVPLTVINDKVVIPGMIPERQLVDEVVKVAAQADGGSKVGERIERGKERSSGLYIP